MSGLGESVSVAWRRWCLLLRICQDQGEKRNRVMHAACDGVWNLEGRRQDAFYIRVCGWQDAMSYEGHGLIL
jgi:hypothetical protein